MLYVLLLLILFNVVFDAVVKNSSICDEQYLLLINNSVRVQNVIDIDFEATIDRQELFHPICSFV